MIFISLEMTSLLPFKLSTAVEYLGVSLEYHGIVVVKIMVYSFWQLKFLVCVAVGFYGKEKATHVKLPVKTDQDTLREGYRYVLLCYYLQFCSWLHMSLLHLFGFYSVLYRFLW